MEEKFYHRYVFLFITILSCYGIIILISSFHSKNIALETFKESSSSLSSFHVSDVNQSKEYNFHDHDFFAIDNEYPTNIVAYKTRRDVKTGQKVGKGLVTLLGGDKLANSDLFPTVSFKEFQETLQCAPTEPGIDGNRGVTKLLKLLRPTRKALILGCVWAETHCVDTFLNWNVCHSKLREFEQDPQRVPKILQHTIRMVRVMDNKLYLDWAYNQSRLDQFASEEYGILNLFQHVVYKINDLKDIVFFFTEESSHSFYNFPLPIFTETPSLFSMDIPIPWTSEYLKEFSYAEPEYHSLSLHDFINNRNPKASFFTGALTHIRQIVFDFAIVRPDLLDVGYLGGLDDLVQNWNPEIDEPTNENIFQEDIDITSDESTIGYIKSLFRFHKPQAVDYLAAKYKYIIVIAGQDGLALADRLPWIIAHSGAVVLLQTTAMEYHFSARLKPWIHYVPISYNSANIIDRIEWLNAHPHLAYRIAQNAKAFGESYLRLEDTYCYVATLFKTLGDILEGSDILIPFEPRLYNHQH